MLFERETELRLIADRAAAISAGDGSVVLLEGTPGIGTSALLDAAAAAARGVRVLRTRGSELEADLAFGAVRELLAGPVLELGRTEREHVLAGPAALALPALGLERAEPGPLADPLHGLFWLTSNLAELCPLMLVVDDAHWLDPESARLVDYLARRIESLPVLLLTSSRPGEVGALAEAATVITPRPLSAAAVAALVGEARAAEVTRLTGGNPLLVRELDRAVEQAPGIPLEDVAPATIARAVLRRVEVISPDAVALAHATALFAGGAGLADAAAVAGLDAARAAAAADALVAARVLEPGERLAFLHPVLRTAVYEALGSFERRLGHARAADALKARGAPPAEIAAHLLAGEPAGDPANLRILQAAADAAAASVAPRAAIRYLERALAEGAAGDENRRRMLVDLGRLQRLVSDRGAQATLARAFADSGGSPVRAEAAIELAATAYGNRDHDAVRCTVRAMERADISADQRLALEMLLAEAAWDRDDRETCFALINRLPSRLPGDTPAQRLALVMAASVRFMRCEPLHEVVALLRRAVGERGVDALVLGVDVGDPLGWLIVADELELAQALAEERQSMAASTGNEALFANMQRPLGWIASLRGELAASETTMREGLASPALSRVAHFITVIDLVETLIMRGRFDEAQTELDRVADAHEHGALAVSYRRAELAAWRGDHATAIPIFERRREREAAAGIRHPNVVTWMTDLLDSLAAAGRRNEAVEAAREVVALAHRTGGVIGLGTFQLALGRLTGDLDELERALEILAASPYRWHRARAELDLGTALRRARERVHAREHLRAALDYAEREGVRHFADRAREELRLAGARPRRALLTGVESLTPAEARIARMAAAGRSNKEIAQALFLTVKTVEMNLVRAYRKLDISSRRELPGALAQG